MKEFIIKTSLTAGIMAILGFVLLIILIFTVDEATRKTIVSGSNISIILLIIGLGTIWGLVGMSLSRKPREAYSPEQLKTQHTWLAIIFFAGAIYTLLRGSFIPAIILTIGALAEWFNRERV